MSLALFISSTTQANTITATQAAAIYPTETTYSIFRKGKNIGKHKLNVTQTGNRIDVSVDSKITVRVLKIPVFKFRYLSSEQWEDNKLVSVESTTTTDKKVETATLKNSGNGSEISYNGKSSTTELVPYATNHWNISAVTQSSLFNTVKGVKSDVTVTNAGKESLEIGGKTLSTTA